jgi:polyhydroxyalkanoate synthesis regulator phasin
VLAYFLDQIVGALSSAIATSTDEFAMSSDNLVQTLQTGFRITVGATASLLESLQDDRKREENLETLKLEWTQIADKWAEKGEQTEQEARNFVDAVISQGQSATSRPPTDSASSSAPETPATDADTAVQTELQELTEQIATLRKELEQLREREDS